MFLELYAPAAALVGVSMLLLWLLSLRLGNASIVDLYWGLGFVLIGALTYVRLGQHSGAHAALLCGATAAWGLRLSLHLAVRNVGHGEDRRYRALREKYAPFWWKSLFIVFALQGALMLVVASPVILGQAPRATPGLTALDAVGLGVFLVGLAWEVVADLQLVRFTRDPAQRGRVLDTGLWRYSRHPNYFGELVLWWGIGLMAWSTPGAAWAAVLGPATITWLLARVSGVPMLEAGMKQRRPEYAAYVARTRALVPGPPRRT